MFQRDQQTHNKNRIFNARIPKDGEGNVFTGVCPSTHGRGGGCYPHLADRGRVPPSFQMGEYPTSFTTGGTLIRTGDVPRSGLDWGSPPPPPSKQSSIASTCYTAGLLPTELKVVFCFGCWTRSPLRLKNICPI